MSETTGAPAPAAAPAPAPASTPTPDAGSPPASSQPSISVTEAARTLAQQRRERQPTARIPPPNQAAAPPARPAETATPAPTEQRTERSDSLDAMAKALGLPEGGAPPAPAAGTPAPLGGTVDIDGTHYTPAQLKAALGQAQDYTKKTQALAQERQQFQEQQQALATVLPYLQPELQRLQQQIQGVQPPDPRLIDSDPQGYMRAQAAWQAAQQDQTRLTQLTQLQQEALQRAMADQVAKSNAALVEQLPGWSDPKQRGEWQQAIAGWAMDHGGFQRQELQGLADHRHLLTMAKAMMWDRMVASSKTTAPVQSAPARGRPPPPAPTERISSAEAAFEAAPSVRNATALLSARRANGAAR